jgi:hypothetical protein
MAAPVAATPLTVSVLESFPPQPHKAKEPSAAAHRENASPPEERYVGFDVMVIQWKL